MRNRWVTAALAASVLGSAFASVTVSHAQGVPAGRVVLQARSALAVPSAKVRATPAGSLVDFDVALTMRDLPGAQALARAVSDPSSARYGRYATPAEWERAFSPSLSSVRLVTSWLRGEHVTIESVAADRMTIHATAKAARVEQAFGVQLNEYRHRAQTVRLAAGALTVPSTLRFVVIGVTGVDQMTAAAAEAPGIAPPSGGRVAPPCSRYFGQQDDTTDPAYGDGYATRAPYTVCGYKPAQLQSAYGIAHRIAAGDDGTGVRVAVVDPYLSPTLFRDAREYSVRNQPGGVLRRSQFTHIADRPFDDAADCGGGGWFAEASLDVEAVHATAPGADLLYEAAQNCDDGLYNSLADIIDHHRADIISNSWLFTGGDLLASAGYRRPFDDLFLMAAATGVGVQFASGDLGDNFARLGATVANYPASSPYVTAVGGTSLKISRSGTRTAELGWSSSGSFLCNNTLLVNGFCDTAQLNTWIPPAPGPYASGGGGGTSYRYREPWYQYGVVPTVLADRHRATTGVANRVEPDVSMDADSGTGMLVGFTQQFPGGRNYGELAEGGTSLATPLLAGVLADADQAAHRSLGFVNPALYSIAAEPSIRTSAFYDETPPRIKQTEVFEAFWNNINSADGTFALNGTLTFEGRETYCDPTGDCSNRRVALDTTRGFDSMTGIGSPGRDLVAALSR